MRRGNLKCLKAVVALLCVGLLSILMLSCGGSSGGSDDNGDIEPQTYTASGNYWYNPDTGMLVLTFILSEFLSGCGPSVGDEMVDVDSITETTMHWVEDDMTWTRDSGAADDILGVWDWVDEDGNAYEITFNNDFSMVVVAEIVDCEGGVAQLDTITGKSGSQVSVNGTWEGACVADGGEGSSETNDLIIVGGSTFTLTANHWFNSMTCAGPSDAIQVVGGTVTKGNEVTAMMGGSSVTATTIDIVINTAQAVANNPATVGDLNAGEECEFDDWAVGVPKNILGTTCMSQTSQKDIIFIDDTADPDLWYSGDEDGPFDANGYPTVIDLATQAERM